MVIVEPHPEPDWTSRNWEAEAKTVSAVLRKYPELYNSRVTYRIDLCDHLPGHHRRHADSHRPQLCRDRSQPRARKPMTARRCTIL